MTRQTAQPLQHMSLQATNRTAADLVHALQRGDLVVDTPYQRGDVWTEDQRIGLINSWMLGLPVPAIITNNRATPGFIRRNPGSELGPVYAVIDGRQRMVTAIKWFTGDLAVPATWFKPDHIEATEDTEDGPYVRFTGLTVVGQRFSSSRAQLPMCEAAVYTIKEEAAIYVLVNGGGTPQTAADMDRAAQVAAGGTE